MATLGIGARPSRLEEIPEVEDAEEGARHNHIPNFFLTFLFPLQLLFV